MGNFEKLSVLVIVVIIVMILVVALYTWTDNPDQTSGGTNSVATANEGAPQPPVVAAGMDAVQIPGPTLAKDKAGPVAGTPKTLAEMLEEAKLLGAKPVEPLPPVPPPAPAPAAPRSYTVKAGDSLSRIAKQEYPKVALKHSLPAILQANPTVVPEQLRPNAVLVLPELGTESAAGTLTSTSGSGVVPPSRPATMTIAKGGTYVVKKGDTLVSISKRAYGTADKWQDIWLTNFDVIDDVDHPAPGTRLKISQ